MVDIINKPYAVISEEWAVLCKRMRDVQALFIPKQNGYPNDTQFLAAQDKLESVLKEMEEYRKTIRITD